ncbi:hypothetical protein [uncultured Friedmanniella sp.]|uniref:hypothetical protein n=1 Tax=uncultured Friedmanniella sp. TaxID=335381 RepID=UPI0035CBB9DE
MAKTPAVADEQITRALALYAGMVGHVLTDPQRWLGLDDEPPPTAAFPLKALDALRDRALGKANPTSAAWAQQPVEKRVQWWVTRIGISAGLAAAAPRLAGALSDRVPLQAALGASAAGLAVCATAREHGRTAPADWVPLLAQVLFDREIAAEPEVPDAEESERLLVEEPDEAEAPSSGPVAALGRGAARAALTVWQLARTFLELQRLLDERPRGSFLTRAVGKLPVVGVAGGWLDERGGITKASRQTVKLLA